MFGGLGSTAAFGAGRSFCQYLGLKPQAESYYPFGISPIVPCRDGKLTAVHVFDSASDQTFKNEDDDEDEYDCREFVPTALPFRRGGSPIKPVHDCFANSAFRDFFDINRPNRLSIHGSEQ